MAIAAVALAPARILVAIIQPDRIPTTQGARQQHPAAEENVGVTSISDGPSHAAQAMPHADS